MTLLRNTESGQQWYPTTIASLESLLSKSIQRGCGFVHVNALRKNIAYNLQYLEFLDKTLLELKLSAVLMTQTYKMFVVVGCGIMESLLAYLLIKGGHYRTTQWELKIIMPGQEKDYNRHRTRIDSHVYRKLPSPKREEMTFDSMIKKAESKKVLGSDHNVYAKLGYLRRLRNKVHLHLIDEPTDTDWNAFQHRHLCAMAQLIHATFTGNIFRPSQGERGFFQYLEKYLAEQVDTLGEE